MGTRNPTWAELQAICAKVGIPEAPMTDAIWNNEAVRPLLQTVTDGVNSISTALMRLHAVTPERLGRPKKGARDLLTNLLTRIAHTINEQVPLPNRTPTLAALAAQLTTTRFRHHFGVRLITADGANRPVTFPQIDAYIGLRNDSARYANRPFNNKIVDQTANRNYWHAIHNTFLDRLHSRYPTAVVTHEQFKVNYDQTVAGMGDVGTKLDGELGQTPIWLRYHPTPNAPEDDTREYTFSDLVGSALASMPYRRFARANAVAAARIAKERNYAYLVGLNHGVPPQYGYLGFDFADVYPPADPREAIVIQQAKQSGLFRERGGQQQFTNVGTNYQRVGQQTFTTQ